MSSRDGGAWIFRLAAAKILLPTALLLLILAAAVFFLVRHVTAEVDMLDRDRAERAVAGAIEIQLEALEALVHDNAYWNEAARVAYLGADLDAFFRETFGYVTADGRGYDIALWFRADGTPRIGYRRGVPIPLGEIVYRDPEASGLQRRLPGLSHSASGIIRLGDRIYMVSRDLVLPESPELQSLVPIEGADILVFGKDVDADLLRRIEQSLLLSGLALTLSQPESSQPSVPLIGAGGEPLVWLS